MRYARWFLYAVLVAALPSSAQTAAPPTPQSSVAQSTDPSVRLKAMMDATSLDSAEAGSWHWKMDVTVYDSDG